MATNKIAEKGGKALLDAVTSFPPLTALYLQNNKVGTAVPKGFKALVKKRASLVAVC